MLLLVPPTQTRDKLNETLFYKRIGSEGSLSFFEQNEGFSLLIRCNFDPSPIRFHFVIGGGFDFLQTINAEVKEMKLRSYTILMWCSPNEILLQRMSYGKA